MNFSQHHFMIMSGANCCREKLLNKDNAMFKFIVSLNRRRRLAKPMFSCGRRPTWDE